MKSVASELVRFLADPSWSEAEFRSLGHLILSGEAKRCFEAAGHIRHVTIEELRRVESISAVEEPLHPSSRNRSKRELSQAVFARVHALLIEEARLSTVAAIERLQSELPGIRLATTRTSLRSAVDFFLSAVDESALVSAAQRVRNRVVHFGPQHPWPLDAKDDR